MKTGLFGKDGSGKSNIIINFLYNYFVDEYDPPIDEGFRKQLTIDEKKYFIDILDTTQNDFYYFERLKELCYRNCNSILTVCDLTNIETLKEVELSIEFYYKVKNNYNIPIVIVGNKLDLIENKEKGREITKEMIDELIERVCKESNLKPIYFETSAKTKFNIDKVFFEVIKLFEYSICDWYNVVTRLLNYENIFLEFKSNKKCIVL
ncbi:hypothetical protein ABK040_014862 [Willaertia magna]